MPMPMKLLLSWDIKPGRESEVLDFVMREIVPEMARQGLQTVEVWYTMAGNGPQFITGAIANDLDTVKKFLDSDAWQNLKKDLMRMVTNYKHKVLPATGRFQI